MRFGILVCLLLALAVPCWAQYQYFQVAGIYEVRLDATGYVLRSRIPGKDSVRTVMQLLSTYAPKERRIPRHFEELLFEAPDGRVFGYRRGADRYLYFVSATSLAEYKAGHFTQRKDASEAFFYAARAKECEDDAFAFSALLGLEQLNHQELPFLGLNPASQPTVISWGCGPSECLNAQVELLERMGYKEELLKPGPFFCLCDGLGCPAATEYPKLGKW